MIGRLVGHYKILARLGEGGMGVVYQAEDARLDRRVAVKFLNADKRQGVTRNRFLQEARTASALSHPHICPVYDVGEFEGRPYIVMEFLEGTTLRELLLQGQVSAENTVDYATQIAEALAAAHAKGIVHRDIKPGNIFVTRENSVKLLDFGIAKRESETEVSESSTLLTQAGATLGTVSYMSPEQALGRSLDHRTDFFSLGIVLYEMSAGQNPFKDATAPSTIDAIVHREPEQLSWRGSRIPAGMRPVISRLLQKSPEKRYQSAAELLVDLQRLEAGGRQPVRTRWLRSPRWRVPVLALLLILIGLAGVTLIPSLRQSWSTAVPDPSDEASPTRPIVAVTRLTPLGGGPETEQIGLGVAYSLAGSLATVPSVTVISPTATLNQTAEQAGAAEIAHEVGAEYVVSGSVQRVGEQLQITLHLIRGGSIVWGGDAEGPASDLFELQRRLVTRIADALQLALSDEDRSRLGRRPTSSKEAYADYTQGRAFLERPDREAGIERAIGLFESALEKDAAFSLAHAGLGEAYWAMYQRTKDPVWTDKARREIQKALELDPEHAGVRLSLALVHFGTGRYEEALQELRQAQAMQPNNDDVYRLRGDALAALGQPEAAAEAYQKAIDLRPNFWGNHRALGLFHFRLGRYQEAARRFHRITELQPDLSWGFHYLGVAYHADGRLPLAEANYRKALELGPSAGAHANLGTIYYRQGDYAGAARHYQEALHLRPADETTLRNLGDTYLKLQNQEQASATYIQALELVREQLRVNPNDAGLLSMAAVLAAKLGRHVEAARQGDLALQEAPGDALVRYRRAVVHALAGQPDTAMQQLERALSDGYSFSEASQDDDLSDLRAREDFLALMQEGR